MYTSQIPPMYKIDTFLYRSDSQTDDSNDKNVQHIGNHFQTTIKQNLLLIMGSGSIICPGLLFGWWNITVFLPLLFVLWICKEIRILQFYKTLGGTISKSARYRMFRYKKTSFISFFLFLMIGFFMLWPDIRQFLYPFIIPIFSKISDSAWMILNAKVKFSTNGIKLYLIYGIFLIIAYIFLQLTHWCEYQIVKILVYDVLMNSDLNKMRKAKMQPFFSLMIEGRWLILIPGLNIIGFYLAYAAQMDLGTIMMEKRSN
jgi:hypothetical protein